MHSTPVTVDTRLIIRNETRIKIKPRTAKASDFRASSSCFASPPEVIILIPEKMTKKRAAVPEKAKSQKIIFAKRLGRQFSVATPLREQSSLNILQE